MKSAKKLANSDQPPVKPASKQPAKPAAAACLMEQNLSLLLQRKEAKAEFDSTETTATTNCLIRHVRSNCPKCPKDSAYLLIGAYYFELYKSRLKKIKSLMIEKEFQVINRLAEESNAEKSPEKGLSWDQMKTMSSDTFSGTINLDSQRKLLHYLIKMIDIWRKLLDVKEVLKSSLIIKLEIFEILKDCYFIFSFYGATKYTKLTCTIYVELVLLHGQMLKHHLLFAYYCQARFHLDYGLLDKASNYLKTANGLIKSTPKNVAKYLVNETYLIKIAGYELRLLTGENVEQAATELKELIDTEYFEQPTAVSGYIKSLACFLLSKFSAKCFPDQDLFKYFNEPFMFVKTLICKWYPFLLEITPQNKQMDIQSPIWLEFAVVRFSVEFALTYHIYAINCSMLNSDFFFNLFATRLSRVYGSLLWLSRNILLSVQNEKPDVQKAKINQAKSLFGKRKSDLDKVGSTISTTHTVARKAPAASRPTGALSNESVVLVDDFLDIQSKENCSHLQDTPIYLLKRSMLKNPILGNDDDLEVLSSYDYERELESLDDCLIPDLIVVRQELLLLLYLINESKPSFVRYFKQLDLEVLNAIYFENLSDALKVPLEKLNRNHQNLLISQFNLHCVLIYLKNVELENPAIIDLTRNVLKKAANLGHSYEIHCFITELVIAYVESLFSEIDNGQLNILKYDFLECEKYLATRPLFRSSSPVRERFNLRSRVKPSAPRKACQYKMDEVRDYIREMYDLNRPEALSKKSSVKLNFTESDEEEDRLEQDKENLKMKIRRLRAKQAVGSQEEDEQRDVAKGGSQNQVLNQKGQKTSTILKENKNSVRFNLVDLNSELNNLNDRISKLGFDDTFEQEVHEYLIDESSDNYHGEFRKLLYKVLDLFGRSPSIKHYNLISGLLFRLSICRESSFGDEAPYYFSEVCQANALRCQTIRQLPLKRKFVSIRYDTEVLQFPAPGEAECKKEELNKILDQLPAKWRILQIQFLKGTGSQTDLYMARYQRGRSTIFLKININPEKLCQNFTEEFNQIIQLSNDTGKEQDTKVFWKLRIALDERLKRLLFDVDSTWINCFIGMFLGECLSASCQKLFKKIENHLMTYAKANHLVCVAPDLLPVICESFVYLKEESFNHAMVSLFEPKDLFDDVYDECVNLAKKHFKLHTLDEVKKHIINQVNFGPTALITGPVLQNFPFESLSCLRKLSQEVFRVPSVRFLNWMYVNFRRTNQCIKQGVSEKEVYYLINPSKDLAHTEEFFKSKFEKLKDKENYNWDGLVGQIPSPDQMRNVLQNKDVYIYLGHNSGGRYLGKMTDCVVNCLSVVMGCSSAAVLNPDQRVESFGMPYTFHINGCPTYVGCLWSVTDRDIDLYAERLLQHTFKIYDQEDKNKVPRCPSITKAVPLSRNICRLKYLNGAAPVVRGLPISMRLNEDSGSLSEAAVNSVGRLNSSEI